MVFPTTRRPQKITDEIDPAQWFVAADVQVPTTSSCPTRSSKCRGRRRSANGTLPAGTDVRGTAKDHLWNHELTSSISLKTTSAFYTPHRKSPQTGPAFSNLLILPPGSATNDCATLHQGTSSMFFRTHGIRLAYDDHGTGVPVVFLHAFPLNRSMWAPQVATPRRISEPSRSIFAATAASRMRRSGRFPSTTMPMTWQPPRSPGRSSGHSGGTPHGRVCQPWRSQTTPPSPPGLGIGRYPSQTDSPEGRTGRFHLAQTAYGKGRGRGGYHAAETARRNIASAQARLVEYIRQTIQQTPVSGIVVDLMAMADRPDSRWHSSRPSPARRSWWSAREDFTTPCRCGVDGAQETPVPG